MHTCTLERKPRRGGSACAEGQPEDVPRGDAAAFRERACCKPASVREIPKYEAPAEKNSGRIEKRTCWQTDYIGWFENIDEWYGLRSVIMVEAEIIHAMCKCASVEAPNGQSSAPVPVSERKAGAGNWCRPLMHLHICTLAHSKESPAGAGADKARGGQPRVNPKDGALADRAVGEATEVRDQGREDVRGSVKGSEAGNADSIARERRSPAPAFSTGAGAGLLTAGNLHTCTFAH